MRVVFFGDSICAGCRAAAGAGWVDMLAQALPAIEVVNAGVNGETTKDALRRFADSVAAKKPDVVYVQFGLNDASWWCRQVGRSWVSEEDFVANMQDMVRRCGDCGAVRVLAATNHPVKDGSAPCESGVGAADGAPETPTYSGTVKRYNAALRQGLAHLPVTLVDMEAAVLAEGADVGWMLHEDGLHLSPQGNAFYAERVGDVLTGVLKSLES